MWKIIKTILSSKKFWYAAAGIIINFIIANTELDPEIVTGLFWAIGGIVVALITGQGLADIGKEAAKLGGNWGKDKVDAEGR